VALLASMQLSAQPAARRATTVPALLAYRTFFHGEPIAVRGELMTESESHQTTWLLDEDARVLAIGVPLPAPGERETVEVSGAFWDLGRLQPDDPRLAGREIPALSERLLGRQWPQPGELLLVIATATERAERPPAVTLRALALEPQRYQDQHVTVTGRFRGRNLYGDLPEAPRTSRWDFVLGSADAAVWIVGKEPRGRGFELDVLARVDTGQWLEVRGTVRVDRHMVLVDADRIALAEPVDDGIGADPVEATPGPQPEVIFSAPPPDDSNVARASSVRLQFSRDMDPDSFDGHVTVRYRHAPDVPVPAPAAPTFSLDYQARNRVLEIRFDAALEPFQTAEVELSDGITATDGAPLVPWTMSFTLGG